MLEMNVMLADTRLDDVHIESPLEEPLAAPMDSYIPQGAENKPAKDFELLYSKEKQLDDQQSKHGKSMARAFAVAIYSAA